MDFITEFAKFLERKPLAPALKKEIISYATNLKGTESLSNLTIETAAENIMNMFKTYPDAENKMLHDYLIYILNKVKEAK